VCTGDIYRRNPARDVERYAIEVVTRWVGDRGQVHDTSAGPYPDFYEGRGSIKTVMVEVIGQYSNLSEQGERLQDLLEMVTRPL
jgi:hypothetical protein